MIHFEKTKVINASPVQVWEVFGNFLNIHKFAPAIKSVDSLTDQKDGVGAKRRCHFTNGGSVAEEITEWEPGRKYSVQLSEMSMPVEEMSSTMSVEPTDGGKTLVRWSMDYRMKYGFLGALIGKTMIKMMMGNVLEKNLNGLEEKVTQK